MTLEYKMKREKVNRVLSNKQTNKQPTNTLFQQPKR